jgi:hypothetical protein
VTALIGQIESITTMTTVTIPAPLPSVARLRKEAAAAIERLIAFLDATEPDTDLEPSLGWTASSNHWLETPEDLIGNANAGDDREDEDEREPPVDDEPSLGWTSNTNQTAAAWHANNLGMTDMEQGVGPVRKARPASKTGNRVLVGWRAEALR